MMLRKRGLNFSFEELECLVFNLELRPDLIIGPAPGDFKGMLEQRKAWEEITDSVSQIGCGIRRAPLVVKKKWHDFKSKVKFKSEQNKIIKLQTGTNPPKNYEFSPLEERALVLIESVNSMTKTCAVKKAKLENVKNLEEEYHMQDCSTIEQKSMVVCEDEEESSTSIELQEHCIINELQECSSKLQQSSASQELQECSPSQEPQECSPSQEPQECSASQELQECSASQELQECFTSQELQECPVVQELQKCSTNKELQEQSASKEIIKEKNQHLGAVLPRHSSTPLLVNLGMKSLKTAYAHLPLGTTLKPITKEITGSSALNDSRVGNTSASTEDSVASEHCDKSSPKKRFAPKSWEEVFKMAIAADEHSVKFSEKHRLILNEVKEIKEDMQKMRESIDEIAKLKRMQLQLKCYKDGLTLELDES